MYVGLKEMYTNDMIWATGQKVSRERCDQKKKKNEDDDDGKGKEKVNLKAVVGLQG